MRKILLLLSMFVACFTMSAMADIKLVAEQCNPAPGTCVTGEYNGIVIINGKKAINKCNTSETRLTR